MKLSTNKKELKALGACTSGYQVFIKAHGENDATLSQCLESNGWRDTWWLISSTYAQFSEQQKTDLRLLGCEYALSVLENFEKEFPEDKRPRQAIEASRAFAKGEITKEDLEAAARSARSAWSAEAAARSAAEAAAEAAAWSAEAAARSAARSARSAAWSAEAAARSAAWSAEAAARSAAEAAARSAARSARSAAAEAAARSAAWSARSAADTKMLMDLLVKWESQA